MATFPVLSDGVCTVHLPFTQRREYLTAAVSASTGWRYDYSWRATPLMRWQSDYQVGDADMATLRDFFIARNGRYDEFTFTDPETSTTYTKVHFGMDTLEIKHVGPNQHQMTLIMEEYA